MPSAQEIAEQAIEKLDQDDNGDAGAGAADDKKGGDDAANKDDKGAGAAGDDKGDSNGGDADKGDGKADDGGDGADDKGKKDDEGKFTADDALEVDDKPAPTNEAPKDAAGIQISPDEGKYIADNIGEAIIIRGIQGEGDNAKEVSLKVYSPGEIPADFKFANDREMQLAQSGFYRLENRAQQLLGDFRNQQSGKAAQDFEQRENQGIRDDVSELQKEGAFPKFKVKPGEAGFDADPAAQQMGDVLKFMAERNDMYLKQYNQGRPYRHIGFREAFELYSAKQSTKSRDTAQQDEDKERKKVADKVATGQGQTSEKLQKPRVSHGTTVSDILNKYEGEEW